MVAILKKFHYLGINLAVTLLLFATIVLSFIRVHETVHIGQALLLGDTPTIGFFNYGKIIFTLSHIQLSETPAYLAMFLYLFLATYSFYKNFDIKQYQTVVA